MRRGAMGLATVFIAALLAAPLAALAQGSSSQWTLGKTGGACSADGPHDKQASLTLVVMSGGIWLLVASNGLPAERAEQQLKLTIDARPSVLVNGDGSGSIVGMPVAPELASRLANAHTLRVAVDGLIFDFMIDGVGGALDGLAQCAGLPTWSQALANPPPLIAGAGQWRLTQFPQGGCGARLTGAAIDTLLLANNQGRIVLAAGRPDWDSLGRQETVTLQVDSGPERVLQGNALENLILVLISDDKLAAELRRAKHLHWTLPQGHFTADVDGLGAAFDAVVRCKPAEAG
jgi:hypothetical protein